ncbi:MAG: hypothetical protein JWM36_1808 [Hyphomicrobiales bacterium]|nr:hypothetical protein [Hyphomicrobiales bacterium]
MTNSQSDFDTARRHFGIAIIDLRYAAADLALSARTRTGDAAQETWIAVDLLHQEIANLQTLSDYIDGIGRAPAPFMDGSAQLTDLHRWWPSLMRSVAGRVGIKED